MPRMISQKKGRHVRAGRALSALLLAGLLALTLAGCSAASTGGQSTTAAYAPEPTATIDDWAAPEEAGEMEYHSANDTADVAGAAAGGPTLTLPQDGRQVILTATMMVETLEYDATCTKLQQAATTVDGYVSATSISGSTVGYRVASFTMRIPATQYGAFMQLAGEAGNVVSRNEYSEEVTQQITDIASRLKVLRTKEERLLALMEEAKRMDDLLLLEDQLSEVVYEIERYTASQKNLEQQVAYSTVDITVYEVRQITEPVEDSYGAKAASAWSGTWASVGRFFQSLGLGIIWALPVLIVLAIVLLVVLLALRRARKKRAANPPAAPAHSPYPPYPVPAPAAPTQSDDNPQKAEIDASSGKQND